MLPNRWAKRLKTQESVQRLLCRLAFLLLAITPTLWILGAYAWSVLPWSQHRSVLAWERSISLGLGVDVDLSIVENPKPFCFRFSKVTLKHSETGETLATIPRIELQMRRLSSTLQIESPQIQLSQAAILGKAIHQRYLCQPNLAYPTVECSVRSLTFVDEDSELEPIDLDSLFQCMRDKSTLNVKFDLAKNDSSDWANFFLERLHSTVVPRTDWTLKTAGLKVPCNLLVPFHAATAQLGPHALFQGNIRWEQDDANWRAGLLGDFENVQWKQLNDLYGLAIAHSSRIHVDLAQMYNGRLVQADGLVQSEAGWKSDLARWLAPIFTATSEVQAASHLGPTSDGPGLNR